MTLKTIINRVRANTHDKDNLEYEDTTVIDYINDGIRFVRRTIMAIDPLQLVESPITGTLTPGQNTITPVNSKKMSAILEVRVDGVNLKKDTPWLIDNLAATGSPKSYYVTGFGTINIWPVPTQKCEYTILAVPDMKILSEADDEFPMMNDLADFVVEYASIRSSLTNEFDVSQENAIMGSIVSQIEDMVRRYNTDSIQLSGYWESGEGLTCDYGRSYR